MAAIEAVLGRLQRVGRHRRAGRLGADLLRRQALLRGGVELIGGVEVDAATSMVPDTVLSTLPMSSSAGVAAGGVGLACLQPIFLDRCTARLRIARWGMGGFCITGLARGHDLLPFDLQLEGNAC